MVDRSTISAAAISAVVYPRAVMVSATRSTWSRATLSTLSRRIAAASGLGAIASQSVPASVSICQRSAPSSSMVADMARACLCSALLMLCAAWAAARYRITASGAGASWASLRSSAAPIRVQASAATVCASSSVSIHTAPVWLRASAFRRTVQAIATSALYCCSPLMFSHSARAVLAFSFMVCCPPI